MTSVLTAVTRATSVLTILCNRLTAPFIVLTSDRRSFVRATEAYTSLFLSFKFMVKTVPINKIITNDLNNIFLEDKDLLKIQNKYSIINTIKV